MNKTRSYEIGFLISLLLSLIAYFTAANGLISRNFLFPFLMALAITQVIVQVTFFLHLREETKPRFNFLIFASTVSLIIFIIIASLWILGHLNYHIKSPDELKNYIFNNEGIHKH